MGRPELFAFAVDSDDDIDRYDDEFLFTLRKRSTNEKKIAKA